MEFPSAAVKRIVELIRGGNYSEHVAEFVALAMQVIQYGISVLSGGGSQPMAAGPPVTDNEGLCTALESAVAQHEGDYGQPMAFPIPWKSLVELLLQLIGGVVKAL